MLFSVGYQRASRPEMFNVSLLRVAILAFENLDKAQAALTSMAFKEVRTIGQKYAKFHAFIVVGVPR
jgi:uncharacterized protein (DUF1330 family)